MKPSPGTWILRWGGYDQRVTVARVGGDLGFVTGSGIRHSVSTVPDGIWTQIDGGAR